MVWASHSIMYMSDNSLNYTGTSLGERVQGLRRGAENGPGQICCQVLGLASRPDPLRCYVEGIYIQICSLSHNGDTLIISAWCLMGLVKDTSPAQTHFMVVTLRRTASHSPRTFSTLVDYEIVPFSWIEEAWANRVSALDESPCSPQAILARDAAESKKNDDALGSVLGISLELPPGDDRFPREALKNNSVHTMQPLGLFSVHKDKGALFAALPVPYHVECLKNSLKVELEGGAYFM
ncbi:hypothetical protein FIBSPDRAFT_563779 [Athelia psychrophila]|uniref:Uncharacterized protein n=1 Tax=Athelia psychrophila TaxID=1759441 RepID=A0A166I8B7_9AGAM|nr:hypothetical protein FIBSPDRAFT_563779 [Fibularhizoctonia sp. CBS 109695]